MDRTDVAKNCDTCFHLHTPKGYSPCSRCNDFDKYAMDSHYFWARSVKDEQSKEKYDVVEKPKHYMLFEDKGIEVRDVIKKLTQRMEDSSIHFDGIDYSDYVQAMQYFMRFMDKNGIEDLNKGVWYMNKIIEAWEK